MFCDIKSEMQSIDETMNSMKKQINDEYYLFNK